MNARKVELSKQHVAILAKLRERPSTTLEILRATGVLSVSARMHELRALGYDITTQLITVRNRHGDRCHVAEYALRRSHRKAVRKTAKRRA